MSVLIKDKTTGQWTDVAGSGGSGGDVSKKYVDDQDQSMLTDAKRYADAAVAPVKETVGDMNGGLVKTVDKLSNDLGAHLQIDQKYKADNNTNILNLTNKANSLDEQLNNENGGVKSRVTALESRNLTLENTVGDSNSGLVKDVSALKTTVGDSNSGLVKQMNDIKAYIRAQDAIDTTPTPIWRATSNTKWTVTPGTSNHSIHKGTAQYDGILMFSVHLACSLQAYTNLMNTPTIRLYIGDIGETYTEAGDTTTSRPDSDGLKTNPGIENIAFEANLRENEVSQTGQHPTDGGYMTSYILSGQAFIKKGQKFRICSYGGSGTNNSLTVFDANGSFLTARWYKSRDYTGR